jgi:hypothetical protein
MDDTTTPTWSDDGDEERHGREVLGDTLAGATRAFLRVGSLNAVKVKAKAAHKALENVAKATEWASLAHEASASTTFSGKVVKAARSYSTGFVLGTVLYATYEDVEMRSGSHVVGGATAGLVHGSLSHLLSAETLPRNKAQVAELVVGLPRSAANDCVSHAVLFGSYAALKRQLLGSEELPLEDEETHSGKARAETNAREVAVVLGAGSAAGAAQTLTESLLAWRTERWPSVDMRSIMRSAPLAGIGFAALELGRALDRRRGGE